jgi:predicted nucleic acid-binding protein
VKVVADSGPLISLASISHLNILHSLFDTIQIPAGVYHEVAIAGRGRSGAVDVAQAKWIEQQIVTNNRGVEQLMKNEALDRGESEAIILAKEINANLLIVDDRTARRCASRQKIPIIGAAGILLLAKEERVISSVKESLDELLRTGFYLSNLNYRKIVKAAGEN